MTFRCMPMPAEDARRWRDTGTDDAGNALLVRVADADAGYPCRVCLCNAKAGEELLLGSWAVPMPSGVYATNSPVFIHGRACPPFDAVDTIAATVRTSQLSLRCYDSNGMMLYDLGVVVDGAAADAPLNVALDDPRTAFVNVHTARPGCWLTRVERDAGPSRLFSGGQSEAEYASASTRTATTAG